MLIEIDPPVIGQYYGLGDKDITKLILSARHEGFSLFPVKEWPCHVYVAHILDDAITKTLTFRRDQIQVIAWGMIFRSFAEANALAEQYRIR
jgi:hypothetical protein